MKEFSLLVMLATILLCLAGSAQAQYWFQSGARGGVSSSNNNGASVQIETVTPQDLTVGSMAFWVGENLPNGGFLQTGYVIENATGNYSTNCTPDGCASRVFLKAGDAAWFYEYFLAGKNGTFLGNIGPDGSVGRNGAFNTYGFYSVGTTWYFTLNNKSVGNVDLGTGSSGALWPVAVGEVANTTNPNAKMISVIFSNFSVYKKGAYQPVSTAYAGIQYGVGSKTDVKNPYGVQEIGNRINYFQVGSGIPASVNNSQLWSFGYRMKVISQYGNLSSANSYAPFSSVTLSAPLIAYISPTARALFNGWTGGGNGAYNGPLNTTSLAIGNNITETANWRTQYFVNISSPFGIASGSGWYGNSSSVSYSVSPASLTQQNTTFVFSGWDNGNKGSGGNLSVSGPAKITALWIPLYNVTIRTIDLLGQPVNATASITFRNGTHAAFSGGGKGIITVPNAPYGYANGTVSFFGINQQVVTSGGNTAILVFPSSISVGVVIVLLALAAYFKIYAKRRSAG